MINLLEKISNIDEDSLSVKEAYEFISNIKTSSIEILKGVNKNGSKN